MIGVLGFDGLGGLGQVGKEVGRIRQEDDGERRFQFRRQRQFRTGLWFGWRVRGRRRKRNRLRLLLEQATRSANHREQARSHCSHATRGNGLDEFFELEAFRHVHPLPGTQCETSFRGPTRF